MDKILAIIMQDNAYREQAKIKMYPRPTTNPINQLITSSGEADKIAEAAQREADNIMAIAFPSGAELPLDTTDTATTQTANSVPPTAPTATTGTAVANRLDHGKQQRPASQSFMMNTIPDNWPEPTANPLLVVNTGHDGNINSFITPTLATSYQNCQGNGNTIAFENVTAQCLPWVNRLQQAAKCSNTALRAALLARAGATVFSIVQQPQKTLMT